MLALVLFSFSVVNAMRTGQDSLQQQNSSIFEKCRSSKCSGATYQLMGEDRATLEFKDCQVNEHKPIYDEGTPYCVEACRTLYNGESRDVSVMRKSGHGQQQCQVADLAMDLGLQAAAKSFVVELEKKALTLTHGNYDELMVIRKVKGLKSFLKLLKSELHKEYSAAEGHGFTREVSSKAQHAVVIGDLHGQLFNLIAYLVQIKEKFENFQVLDGSSLLLCDPRIQYVFMGDYVDRGERGLELLLLLLAYKARCPSGLILLQGNHEQETMWAPYGFQKELQWKLQGQISPKEILEVVTYLPFVAVKPGTFMAMHGGLNPGFVEKCTKKNGQFGKCLDSETAFMTVWADPHDGSGWIQSHRGPGVYKFGMDIAEKFLESNDLHYLFRGHEQVQKGLAMKEHKKRYVVTVFSAADYVGVFCEGNVPEFDRGMFSAPGEGNRGAYVLVGSEVASVTMSARETRSLAAKFTGARCGTGLLETSQAHDLESYIQENHKRLGNHSTCSLDHAEVKSLQEEVHKILSTAEDKEFEARKLVDLQGEALVHGESTEICKSMKKDRITLEVYKKLGTETVDDEEILDQDIMTRENELEKN